MLKIESYENQETSTEAGLIKAGLYRAASPYA